MRVYFVFVLFMVKPNLLGLTAVQKLNPGEHDYSR
jgi:hypothetical protein